MAHSLEVEDAPGDAALAGVIPATQNVVAEVKTQAARVGPLLDPGWMFLVAGVAILAAVVLLPAQDALDASRLAVARMHAVQENRGERLERYQRYLSAVQRKDADVVRSLAATQLNQAPEGQELLLAGVGHAEVRSASVFQALEPTPLELPQRLSEPSLLQRWATDARGRLWLIAAGAVCLFIGLLPPARR